METATVVLCGREYLITPFNEAEQLEIAILYHETGEKKVLSDGEFLGFVNRYRELLHAALVRAQPDVPRVLMQEIGFDELHVAILSACRLSQAFVTDDARTFRDSLGSDTYLN